MGAKFGAEILRRDCISKWGQVGKEERFHHRVNRGAAERTETARGVFTTEDAESTEKEGKRKITQRSQRAQSSQRRETQTDR
jgi:hypothetical protein